MKMTDEFSANFKKYNQWRVQSLYNPFFKQNVSDMKLNKDKLEDYRYALLDAHVKKVAKWTTNEDGNIVTPQITLSELENQIITFIKSMQESYPDHPVHKTQPRLAGGWCRDKLLGKDSNDLDFALDNLDGEAFSNQIVKYQKKQGMETRTVGIIASNPEQSKHLKTATTHIYGLGIDFVNLRSESYTEDSRIPDMSFGTPLDDANRRDLTINALFYNIKTNQLEDFTERGVQDLMEGIIRTPLDPEVTFRDDPLRILRAIRFASRFHFILEDSIVNAARKGDIQDALRMKVSRERVGTELHKMLKSHDPVGAIACMHELQVLPIIFAVQKDFQNPKKKGNLFAFDDPIELDLNEAYIYNGLYRMRRVVKDYDEFAGPKKDNKRDTLALAAFLSVIPDVMQDEATMHNYVQSLTRASWKLSRNFAQDVSSILEGSFKLRSLIIELFDDLQLEDILKIGFHYYLPQLLTKNVGVEGSPRERLGDFARTHKKYLLESCLLMPLLLEKMNLSKDINVFEAVYHYETGKHLSLGLDLASFFLTNKDMVNLTTLVPYLNGRDISKELGVRGKQIGVVLHQSILLQMRHPHASKDEILEILRK